MAAAATAPFRPTTAGTVTVAATTTSGSTVVALVGTGTDLLVQNTGTATAFLEQGASTQTAATATGLPIQPGAIIVLGRQNASTHVVAITASGTATLYVTTGEGS